MSALNTTFEEIKSAIEEITLEEVIREEVTSEEDIFEEDTSEEDTSEEDTSEEDTSEEDTSEEDTSEEDTSEEDTSEEDIFEEDTSEEDTSEEDTYTPKVHEIKWEKKVRPDGFVAFFTDLDDGLNPLSPRYIRVFSDLIYSFLREHEDKDVLMCFGCSYRLKFHYGSFSQYVLKLKNRTETFKTNTRFVKLGECEVEKAVENLLINLHHEVTRYEFGEKDVTADYSFCLGVTSFYIIFKLK